MRRETSPPRAVVSFRDGHLSHRHKKCYKGKGVLRSDILYLFATFNAPTDSCGLLRRVTGGDFGFGILDFRFWIGAYEVTMCKVRRPNFEIRKKPEGESGVLLIGKTFPRIPDI